MRGLVIIGPEAPGGFRKVSYGLVVNGCPLRSPAMRKLVGNLLAHQLRWAEKDRQEVVWVERQMATTPSWPWPRPRCSGA